MVVNADSIGQHVIRNKNLIIKYVNVNVKIIIISAKKIIVGILALLLGRKSLCVILMTPLEDFDSNNGYKTINISYKL